MLTVTKNLHQALQQLRDIVQDRILWIDAICINQGNENEKGHKVQQMGEIYKQADRVLFYLGEGNLEVDTFMDALNMMGKLSLDYPCRRWTTDDEGWDIVWTSAVHAVMGNPSPRQTVMLQQGYWDLLKRSWFTRVWILQEAANARAGLVLCGSKTAKPWLFQVVKKHMGIDKSMNYEDFRKCTPGDHCQAVLDVMPGPWRNSSWWNRNRDLYTLLSRFGGSKATEPRDLIYALRAMSSDAKHEPNLYPDYTKSEEQLVRDTILFLYPLQNEDLAALLLPMTVRDLVFELGNLGHHIYGKMLEKVTGESLDNPATSVQTQTWDLISPYRLQEKRWATKLTELYSPSAISSRLLLAKLQSDRTGDAVALFRFGLSKDNLKTEHLIAAAENLHGVKPLEIVLDFVDHEFKITEEVSVSAAWNRDHGDKMTELLLHHPSYERRNTKSAAMVAAYYAEYE